MIKRISEEIYHDSQVSLILEVPYACKENRREFSMVEIDSGYMAEAWFPESKIISPEHTVSMYRGKPGEK